MPQSGVGAEIGVSRGKFSKLLIAEGNPQLLHLIDPWEKPADLIDKSELFPQAKAEKVYHSVHAMYANEIQAGRLNLSCLQQS